MEQNKREIKFRVWDKQEQEMLYSDSELIKNFDIFSGWWFEEGKESVDRNRMVLMQFTGMKDREGNDIFEGDIVKYNDGKHMHFDTGIYEIRSNGVGMFLYSEEDDYDSYDWCKNFKIELTEFTYEGGNVRGANKRFRVIGNIYENHNLLDEE